MDPAEAMAKITAASLAELTIMQLKSCRAVTISPSLKSMLLPVYWESISAVTVISVSMRSPMSSQTTTASMSFTVEAGKARSWDLYS